MLRRSDLSLSSLPLRSTFTHCIFRCRYDHSGDVNETVVFWQQIVDWKMQNYPGMRGERRFGSSISIAKSALPAQLTHCARLDVPFTISETGAGGVYEWTNSSDPKWSQHYQNEVGVWMVVHCVVLASLRTSFLSVSYQLTSRS